MAYKQKRRKKKRRRHEKKRRRRARLVLLLNERRQNVAAKLALLARESLDGWAVAYFGGRGGLRQSVARRCTEEGIEDPATTCVPPCILPWAKLCKDELEHLELMIARGAFEPSKPKSVLHKLAECAP